MFENIGGKIKKLASTLTVIGILASILIGFIIIIMGSQSEEMGATFAWIGILVMIFGSLMSWLSSFLLYGFGELVESNEIMKKLILSKNPEFTPKEPEAEPKETWICPMCCRKNSIDDILCKCGYENDKPYDAGSYIICPNCQNHQEKQENNHFCASCGNPLDK